MQAIISAYCRLLKVVAVAILAIMVALVFGNVFLRYAFNSGITVSEELSRWLFVWLTFFGSIYALREHQHLGSDFLLSRLGRQGKIACLVVGQLLMLWICWLLFFGALAQTRLNWSVTAPSSELSLAWFYASGAVFGVSAAVVLVEQIIRTLRGDLPDAIVAEEKL
jgi:TRAP-type transport system small permease protein